MPFKKGEILYVLNKDEDQWWTARNAQGMVGQIPVPYVQKVSKQLVFFLFNVSIVIIVYNMFCILHILL